MTPKVDVEKRERAGVAGQKEAGADEHAADERADLRTLQILNAPGGDERQRKDHDGNRVDPRGVGARPSELAFEGQHEDAPGVQRPERQVHQDAANDGKPAVRHEAGL